MKPPEVEFAEAGLSDALVRLQASLPGTTRREYMQPLFETLAWLYGLHEWHKNHLPDFFNICGADVGGRTLQGIVWARGAVQRELIDVSKLVTVLTSALPAVLPMVLAGTRTEVHWLASAQLPSGLAADNAGRDGFYRGHVADRPLLGPLLAARALLVSLS